MQHQRQHFLQALIPLVAALPQAWLLDRWGGPAAWTSHVVLPILLPATRTPAWVETCRQAAPQARLKVRTRPHLTRLHLTFPDRSEVLLALHHQPVVLGPAYRSPEAWLAHACTAPDGRPLLQGPYGLAWAWGLAALRQEPLAPDWQAWYEAQPPLARQALWDTLQAVLDLPLASPEAPGLAPAPEVRTLLRDRFAQASGLPGWRARLRLRHLLAWL